MGYRERRAHKSQQAQESLGQKYSSERRAPMPAPRTMNTRDNPLELPPSHAILLEDAIPSNDGLKIVERPRETVILSSTSASVPHQFIHYNGCGTASAEFWVICANRIHRLTSRVGESTPSTATATTTGPGGNTGLGDHVQFNNTVIYVVDQGPGASLQWTRASSWHEWSASVSGTFSVGDMYGISKFKQRLIAWPQKSKQFFYGSTDQSNGTLKPFDLGGIMNGTMYSFVSFPRDGGAGPDDYACFISDEGEVVMYAGTDPSDASNWSLVGVFKIGRPVGKNAHVSYGDQVVVLCEDDFYFLPQDLYGKKSSSLAQEKRQAAFSSLRFYGVYDETEGVLLFSDGSVLDPKRNWAYSTITLCSAEPHKVRLHVNNFWGGESEVSWPPTLGTFKGKTYCLAQRNPLASTSASLMTVNKVFPTGASTVTKSRKARIKTAPLKTGGRTNISLVNPVFHYSPPTSASAPHSGMQLNYKAAVVYDNYRSRYTTASSELLITSSANLDSRGLWTPGYGTGDYAQLYVEVTTATAGADIYLSEFNFTIGNTGGI